MIRLLQLLLVLAQPTATVSGVVRTPGGRPVAAASVRFEPGPAATVTDASGRFALGIAAATSGLLITEADGFLADTERIAPLAAGSTRRLALTLRRRASLAPVAVTAGASRPLVNTTDAAVGGAVDRADLVRIPTDAHDAYDVALSIPGVTRGVGFFDFAPRLDIDGANALYTPYFVDGLDDNEDYLGGPKVLLPLDAIQLVDVKAAAYGADRGKSANGILDFVTRRGGDEWTGSAFVNGRPGAPPDASSGGPGFRRLQGGAAGGGPLVAGRTYVFGAGDYSDADSSVSYAFGPPLGSGVGNSHRTTLRLFGRLDQQWSPTQLTTLSVGYSRIELAGQGGGVVTPEADQTQNRVGLLAALRHWSDIGGWTNTGSVHVSTYHYYYPPSNTPFSVPQVNLSTRADSLATVATVGSAGFLFNERELQVQVRDVLQRTIGDHQVQFGGEINRNQFTLGAVNTNPAGTYGVLDSGITVRGRTVSIADIPASVPVFYYTIDANPQDIHGMQVLVGAFAQDAWSVSSRLTVTYGLRWDYDDLTDKGRGSAQLDNIQPRASFNWRPTDADVIRGGAGIYVGKIPFTTYTDYRQFARNGDLVVTFMNPAFGFRQGPTPAEAQAAKDAAPAREIRELYYFGAKDPQSYQAALGYQRRIGQTWSVSLDGSVVGTKYLPRIWDLNAPPCDPARAPCTAQAMQRPDGAQDGSYSFHTTTDFGGQSIYWGVTAAVRHQLAANWTADVSYTLSRIRDNTEDINFAATYANDFHNEWADAVGDRRHHVQGRTAYTLRDRLQLSTIADFATGTPQNVVAPIGADFTGSGNAALTANFFDYNYQRVPGTARNSRRLPSEFNQSIGVQYELPTPGGRVTIRADVFNIWNQTLVSGFVNNVPGGGPRTLIPSAGDQPYVSGIRRAFQFGATYSF